MKSGIVSRRDPFLMDPSFMVDPNFILDYGSSFKDETQLLSLGQVDPLLDLINCNDNQLENIIFDTDFGTDYEGIPWETDFDLDEIFRENESPEIEAQTQAELEVLKQEIEISPCALNDLESEIANYEEVSSDESASLPDLVENVNVIETEQSFSAKPSTQTLKMNTRKRKIVNTKEVVEVAPKRRKANRRTKRVQDERVKNQNKIAALKYRKKKKEEKEDIDGILEIEEETNRKLKAEVEELKVNIDVLKELLGKYLAPNQLIQSRN